MGLSGTLDGDPVVFSELGMGGFSLKKERHCRNCRIKIRFLTFVLDGLGYHFEKVFALMLAGIFCESFSNGNINSVDVEAFQNSTLGLFSTLV